MDIEQEIFKRCNINEDKLTSYGFKKDGDIYVYKTKLLNEFLCVIKIKNKKVTGKIYDDETKEEYVNYRIKNVNLNYANKVKREYIKLLNNIKEKCFDATTFNSNQANRIASKISDEYNVRPEFLWSKYPNYAIFRCSKSKKWFAIIMNLPKNKVTGKDNKEVEILNLKLGSETENYLKEKGIYKAYHMNKKNWVTIILDNTLVDTSIMELIKKSYILSGK